MYVARLRQISVVHIERLLEDELKDIREKAKYYRNQRRPIPRVFSRANYRTWLAWREIRGAVRI